MDDSNPVDGTATVVSSLQDWARQPFSATMDLTHWFLWSGLLIVFAIAWFMILREVDL